MIRLFWANPLRYLGLTLASVVQVPAGSASIGAMSLTTDLTRDDGRPYFLWDEPLTIGELRARLAGPQEAERLRLLAKMLREARDSDVWLFVTPAEVADALPRIQRALGRRAAFWEWLIDGWRRDGLLA